MTLRKFAPTLTEEKGHNYARSIRPTLLHPEQTGLSEGPIYYSQERIKAFWRPGVDSPRMVHLANMSYLLFLREIIIPWPPVSVRRIPPEKHPWPLALALACLSRRRSSKCLTGGLGRGADCWVCVCGSLVFSMAWLSVSVSGLSVWKLLEQKHRLRDRSIQGDWSQNPLI